MQTEGMIADLVRNLLSDSPKLRMLCARAIFRLAEEGETRDLVRYNGGLDPLVEMLNNKENQNDMVSSRESKYFVEYPENVGYSSQEGIDKIAVFSFLGADGSSNWSDLEMCNG